MTLLESLQNNMVTLIAMFMILKRIAGNMWANMDKPLTGICVLAKVNRTQIYEHGKLLEELLAKIVLPGPGRPCQPVDDSADAEKKGLLLYIKVLCYCLDHPGALVAHAGGRTTYSDGFIRFILDLLDEWKGSREQFCEEVKIPYQTLCFWINKDQVQPFEKHQVHPYSFGTHSVSDLARDIARDYSLWEGSLRDFFKYECPRLNVAPSAVRRLLVITGQLPVRSQKGPRYRDSTTKTLPGSILVTDGKEVTAVCSSGEVCTYNWQGIIDQSTTCHTAVVVNDTECAEGVREAFDESVSFLGHPPEALVHDNKPIHDDQELRGHVEKTTLMIPATPGRGENKAGIEGEFGKFEQTVGTIFLDDKNEDALKKSAVHEVIRAYTAGINHAGRAEFDGESRESVLRETCPDPEKDREFIAKLHADHTKTRVDILPTKEVSRKPLDEGFARFGLTDLDPKGRIREWLAGRYSPEAIRQGLAIFGTEQEKGRLQNKTAHRYLVKVIQNCQHEIDLRRQEELLREFAEVEQPAWLEKLEKEHEILVAETGNSPVKELAFTLADYAVFGCMIIQRAFWENKLKAFLEKQRDLITAVSNHIRRLFEATWENRFALISKLVNWEFQLAR